MIIRDGVNDRDLVRRFALELLDQIGDGGPHRRRAHQLDLGRDRPGCR
jgi:hypothetical protein